MTSALPIDARYDQTSLPNILRSGVKLGVLQSALVAAFALLQVRLEGVAELLICGGILLIGIAVTVAAPGLWTRARTIEGIAGAAGIGYAAAIVFLIVDVVLFQPVHLYTNRWLEIGGGSNWWYHPVWWMVGTYLPWMGAWILANQTAKLGSPAPVVLILQAFPLAIALLGLSILLHVPNASWGLGGFAVAVLPALALLTAVSLIGVRRK